MEPSDHAGVLDELERVLGDVERALSQLDDGTYGICGTCGAGIADDDLARAPLLRSCPEHATTSVPAP
jgi:RNA polymerase-binding transcription factor DksA